MGKEVFIPFGPDMRLASLEGKKGCTFRTRKLAEIGDWFKVSGRFLQAANPDTKGGYSYKIQNFTVRDVVATIADRVTELLYVDEGFPNPQAFRDYYIEAKNKARERWGNAPVKFRPDEKGYVHWYREHPIDPKIRVKLQADLKW